MYSNRDKIEKKGNVKPTEVEDEVAKALFEFENTLKGATAEKTKEIKKIKLASAQNVVDGATRVLLITVPYPLYHIVRANYNEILPYLEAKFKCPVTIVAQRKILSKHGTSSWPLTSYREA